MSSFRLPREHQPNKRGNSQAIRAVIRVFLVAAIFALARYQGYTNQAFIYLFVLVSWAAVLPVLLRATTGLARSYGFEESRNLVAILSAVALLIAFALGARLLLPS